MSSTYDTTHKNPHTPTKNIFVIASYTTCRAFEQLSTTFGARVALVQSEMRSGCFGANRLI